MAGGEFALVRQELEMAFGQGGTDDVGQHDVQTTLVDVASLQQDEAAIRRYAPGAEALARRSDHKLYLGVIHRGWGVAHRLAGEYEQAEARFNQALALFTQLGTRWQLGRTFFELGQLAAARGDQAEAGARLTQAIALFDAMRAAPDLARARAALQQLN